LILECLHETGKLMLQSIGIGAYKGRAMSYRWSNRSWREEDITVKYKPCLSVVLAVALPLCLAQTKETRERSDTSRTLQAKVERNKAISIVIVPFYESLSN